MLLPDKHHRTLTTRRCAGIEQHPSDCMS